MNAMGIKSLFNAPHAGILAQYDHRFILNLKLTHQIMAHLSRTNKLQDKLYVELGPGAGALTRSLLTRPSVGVLGIEVDAKYNALLEQIQNQTQSKFRYVNENILNIDEFDVISRLFPRFAAENERRPHQQTSGLKNAAREQLLRQRRLKQEGVGVADKNDPGASSPLEDKEPPEDLLWWAGGEAKVEAVGNLPFSIITELLMRYAVDCSQQRGLFRFGRVPLHVFVQKEIAERLTATPGTPQFSRLSVLAQNFFRVSVRQTLKEMTYFPRTEVLGCLVTLEPRVAPLVNVNASVLINFNDLMMRPGSRNTMVINALKKCVPQEVALYMLQELRLDGAVLPAQLSTVEVAKMALMWQKFLEATNQTGAADASSSTPRENSCKGSSDNNDDSQSRFSERTFEHVRTHLDAEQATLNFDWEKEERFARAQREKINTKAKRNSESGAQWGE